MWDRIKQFGLSVGAYFWFLWPPNQTKGVSQAYTEGYNRGFREGVDDGIEGVCVRLANVNRQTRRRVIRDIVSQYKDEERMPA